MTQNQFSNLPLSSKMLDHLEQIGYNKMTPIQQKALPHLLKRSNLIAQAKTGSGKTAAFALALLHHLNQKQFRVQSLVLCPTRELAEQVAGEIRKLAQAIGNVKVLLLCGGVPIRPQLESLLYGAHIVVGTPGRILRHLKKRSLNLKQLKTVVLDEGDRLIDMGFSEDIEAILAHTPKHKNTLLFSATYPPAIQKIASHYLHNPIMIKVDTIHAEGIIDAHWYRIGKGRKNHLLLQLLGAFHPQLALIFCNTKQMVSDLAHYLTNLKIYAQGIHGDLDQQQRQLIFARFKNGSYPILIATDVAARGLDIEQIDLVINYDLPLDPEIYIHRIGRTGRAGKKGTACNIYTELEQVRINQITQLIKKVPTSKDPSTLTGTYQYIPKVVTLSINGGKKRKIRKGDILGALTRDHTINGENVGRIEIFDHYSYVALKQNDLKSGLKLLEKIKGRSFKVKAHTKPIEYCS